jgi:restriction system protein
MMNSRKINVFMTEHNLWVYGIKFAIGIIVVLLVTRQFKRWLRWLRFKRIGAYRINQMSGLEFEQFLQDLFVRLGYEVELTKASGDFGADLILHGEDSVVIQAKRYDSNVSLAAIQEVYAAKAYYGTDEAWVITNSQYTKSAQILAEACDVRLIDGLELFDILDELQTHK